MVVSQRNWLAIILFAPTLLIVGALSLFPQTAPPGGGIDDLSLHALTYGALAMASVWVFKRRWHLAVLVVLLYSAGIEGLQHFVPGRHGSLEDLAANVLGILIGVGAGTCLLPPSKSALACLKSKNSSDM